MHVSPYCLLYSLTFSNLLRSYLFIYTTRVKAGASTGGWTNVQHGAPKEDTEDEKENKGWICGADVAYM